MPKKKTRLPDPAPVQGRLGPPPQTILRGGPHDDERQRPRAEAKRLAIREALSSFPGPARSGEAGAIG